MTLIDTAETGLQKFRYDVGSPQLTNSNVNWRIERQYPIATVIKHSYRIYSDVVMNPVRPRAMNEYPAVLLRLFVVGIITFFIGIVSVVVDSFLHVSGLNFVAALLLVFGSTAITLTILRGQDIDERRS